MKIRFTLKFCILLVLATLMPMLNASAEVLSTTFYHNDLLGSPIAATDESGNLKWREQYRPYGERILNEGVASDNLRWYTGHPQDANTGLIYAGARYYDPVVGRFMAIDPQEFTENNPSSFNRYAYANNNPYLYVDPNGEYIEIGFELISIGIGAKSLINNLSNGNYWGAGGDSIALVTDVTLLFIPGAPGITGSIRQAGNVIDDVAMSGASVAKGAGKEIGILRDAAKGKGNFGLGSGSRTEADKLGKAWVGDGARVASDGKTLVSKDGLRVYRPPSAKPNSPHATTGVQANFERKIEVGGRPISNGHLDIVD